VTKTFIYVGLDF